jgi:hypothetical protein
MLQNIKITFFWDVTFLFADDINIQIEADNAGTLNRKIKGAMQQLSRWFYINKLVINAEKTTAISFHAWQNKNKLKPQIVFRDMDIRYKGETKFLGLYLTEDVKWDVHRNHISNILNRSYYVIQSLENSISINTLRSIYFAIFRSQLRYGIIFWGVTCKAQKFLNYKKKKL